MTGIVAAIPYAFIFPPALYLKLDPNASMVHSGKVLAVLQLAFGVVFFVLGLTGRVICLVKNTTFCRSSQKEQDFSHSSPSGCILKLIKNVSEQPDLAYCDEYCNVNTTLAELTNMLN